MRSVPSRLINRSLLALAVSAACALQAHAQDVPEQLDRVEVLGSHIRKVDVENAQPILTIDRTQIDRSGLSSIGEVLQDLTSGGKALSSQFNSSGNFGAPPDGGGIGAGSAQVDLRHLESKRVLVLVDGRRWVNETSGSGVGGSVDLNTIPLAIVQSIDVLADGASAVYGSDAIAGVINIVTRKDVDGVELFASRGQFDAGDGDTTRVELALGGTAGRAKGMLSLGYNDQGRVSSADRDISDGPPAGVTRGSPVTPQGRSIFVPLGPLPRGVTCPPTVDVNGDGVPDVPLCDLTAVPGAPVGANDFPPFRAYTDADAYNAQPDNLLLTPNRRKHVYASGSFELSDHVTAHASLLYNNRTSVNQAAPNAIVIGPEAPGNGIADAIGVSRLNPYNPFGFDLIAGVNMFVVARRPVEGGPRIFEQDVDTRYANVGIEGDFTIGDRTMFWDVDVVDTRSEAKQVFRNAYNLANIKLALGDPAACAAVAGCTPLNLFGGIGPDGAGTITPEMLAWIRTDVHDASDQAMRAYSAKISGDLFGLPGGTAGFAAGVEQREYEGTLTPDPMRSIGVVFDQAGNFPVRGDYAVNEAFVEADLPVASSLDVSAAGRWSDYGAAGSVLTGKLGVTWKPLEDLLVRGNASQGFRAPFIGEQHGLSQFGALIADPCSNYTQSGNATLISNCQALGVPATYRQLGTQVFTTVGGNPDLKPESSQSRSFGVVYSPRWARDAGWSKTLDLEATYYSHVITDAIQAPDAQDVLDACVASGNAASIACTGIQRAPNGTINAFDNRLANIGRIETDGVDVRATWSLDTRAGAWKADWQSTYVDSYEATDAFGNRFSRTVGVEVSDSAIPRWQSNLSLGWSREWLELGWTMRFIDAVVERCSDSFDNNPTLSLTAMGLCSDPAANAKESRNRLGAVTYHDVYAGWRAPFGVQGLKVSLVADNVFDKAPPTCFSCSLNGYDAGTYDLPGTFWTLQAAYRF